MYLFLFLLSIDPTPPPSSADVVETFDLSRLDAPLARRLTGRALRLTFIVDSASCKVAGCVEFDGIGSDGQGHIIRFARGHEPGPMPKGKSVVVDAHVCIVPFGKSANGDIDEVVLLRIEDARRVR